MNEQALDSTVSAPLAGFVVFLLGFAAVFGLGILLLTGLAFVMSCFI